MHWSRIGLDAKSLRSGAPVERLQPERWWMAASAGYDSESFDAVIIATPVRCRDSVETADRGIRPRTAGIEYSSSMTVSLWDMSASPFLLPAGFGFLVPRAKESASCGDISCTINFRFVLRTTVR